MIFHDAQYTAEEYKFSRAGWDHTSFEHAIAAAKRSQVKRLALFHHDPERTDVQIDELSKKYCTADGTSNTKVFFAREEMQIKL